MFTIEAPKTIPASLKIVGQGREQKLDLVYRAKTRDEYQALIDQLQKGELTVGQVLLELIESWDADMPLDNAGIDAIQQHQPGLDYAILGGYRDAREVSLKGN